MPHGPGFGKLRQSNKQLVLQCLRQGNAYSRAEIARITGLSIITVSKIVAELLQERLIERTGKAEAPVGRRPELYRVAGQGKYVLGLDLAVHRVTAVALDLSGKVVAQRVLQRTLGVPDLLAAARTLAQEVLAAVGASRPRLVAAGVAFPGIWRSQRDTVALCPTMKGLEGIGLRGLFEQHLGVPVEVVNDANAAVVAEHQLGAARGIHDVVYVMVNEGIGAGILTGGRLLGGLVPSPGEIGHTPVMEGGPRCGCGNYGCLEAVAGFGAMRRRMAAGEDENTVLSSTAAVLGRVLATLVNMLAPGLVVLGGDMVRAYPSSWQRVAGEVRRRAIPVLAQDVQFLPGTLENVAAIGAAFLALDRVLAEPQFPLAREGGDIRQR